MLCWFRTFTLLLVIVLLSCILLAGCGLRVTKERPSFEDLESYEKSAVEIIVEELDAFNQQVEALTPYSIESIVNLERINVSFDGVIIAVNLGDELVHVAIWENLSDSQRALVQQWFQSPTLQEARLTYERFFYRYMALSQGAKQYMYESLTTSWVFGHRSIYSVELDSARIAMAHFENVGRKEEMWTFLTEACAPIRKQYDAKYSASFGRSYFNDHFRDLLGEGTTPTGYMYYACRWIEMAQQSALDLKIELDAIAALSD